MSGERVGPGQEAHGAMKVVAGIFLDCHFEIGQSGCGLAQQHGANAAPVEGIERIGAGGDCFVERVRAPLEIALIHIEVAELFKVGG